MGTILPVVQMFASVWTQPSFENARYLMMAWLKTARRAQLSNLLRARRYMPGLVPRNQDGEPKHFSVFYRLFSRAEWSLDQLGHRLAQAFEWRLPDDQEVILMVDDTLQTRSGPRLLGGGIHRDGSVSNDSYGDHTRFNFGLNFVVLALWIPIDGVEAGGLAIPVGFRLYRSQETCPDEDYTKRTELAAELIAQAAEWWPNRSLVVAVDQEYTCKELFQSRPDSVELVGRFQGRWVARDPDVPPSRRGPPRKWGDRFGTFEELADDERLPWWNETVEMYGHEVSLQIKWLEIQWKSARPDDRLTVILTRDPTGTYDDAYWVRTCADASIEDVIGPACKRWGLEVAFRNCKQQMRISSVQNGFAQGDEPVSRTSGPSAPEGREPTASRRTVPFGMITYGIVILWYLKHGTPEADLQRARRQAPWYTHKRGISFRDMLEAFRRQLEAEGLWQSPPEEGWRAKTSSSSPGSSAKAS